MSQTHFLNKSGPIYRIYIHMKYVQLRQLQALSDTFASCRHNKEAQFYSYTFLQQQSHSHFSNDYERTPGELSRTKSLATAKLAFVNHKEAIKQLHDNSNEVKNT